MPRYERYNLLGQGGFSSVYHGWDHETGQAVAIKVFLKQDAVGIALCEMEYQRTNALNHPNIIRLTDFGHDNGIAYIVMPFYSRGSMQDRIKEVTEEELWKLIHDIASALEYVHALRPPMLHNDLKPDNFLIGDDGRYILADFGISMELSTKLLQIRDGHNLDVHKEEGRGPMAYQAPELFDPKTQQRQMPVRASEIWSLGACLYELATGEPPFGERGGWEHLMLHEENATPVRELVDPLPNHFSGAMGNLIFDCLAFNPWERPRASILVNDAEVHLYNSHAEGGSSMSSASSVPSKVRETFGERSKPVAPPGKSFLKKPVGWLIVVISAAMLWGMLLMYLWMQSNIKQGGISPKDLVSDSNHQLLSEADKGSINRDAPPARPPKIKTKTNGDNSNTKLPAKQHLNVDFQPDPVEYISNSSKKSKNQTKNSTKCYFLFKFTNERRADKQYQYLKKTYPNYSVIKRQTSATEEYEISFGYFSGKNAVGIFQMQNQKDFQSALFKCN